MPDTLEFRFGGHGDFVGEKMRHLRKKGGFTQDDVAKGTGLTAPQISLIEKGSTVVSYSILSKFKEFFGIVNAPITKDDKKRYRMLLYNWLNAAKKGLFDDAEALRNELADIRKLDFEPELITLFDFIEARYFIARREFEPLNKLIRKITSKYKELDYTDECMYHFFVLLG